MLLRFAVLAGFGALCFGQQTPDPAVIGRKALDLVLSEKYPELRAMFTEQMRAGLTEETLRDKIGPRIKSFGELKKTGDPITQKVRGYDVVIFPCEFAAANVDFQFTVDHDGKIAGFFFRPGHGAGKSEKVSWTAPAYVNAAAFRERDVTVGTGEWKLPGTLAVPVGAGPFPGVVLVHGSGPEDRDETIFGNKPFRDLAEGLAPRGIAVLRYDKRTEVYAAQIAGMKDFTVRQETVDDALAAIAVLRQQPEIDPKRVFVLGHSLGGYLGPEIANLDGRLAGLIIMGGSFRPMPDLILQQSEYLGASPEQLKQLRDEVAKIKNLKAGPDNPSSILNAPSSYWLNLATYNPGKEARALNCRILVLQGGRDYQVTNEDFSLWQSALKGKRDVTFHEYPALNHLFITGEGKSMPSEYQHPGHVSAEVIGDIANWVKM